MPRGKPAKLAGKKVIPQSIGSADANSARDRLRRAAKVSADLKEFRLSPLRCGNESLARACQDAAGRTSFDQLSFQFVLEGGELPRHGRMVHAQTPRGTENLTRAGDLQEYADTPSTSISAQQIHDSSHRCADFNISPNGEIAPICVTVCADERLFTRTSVEFSS